LLRGSRGLRDETGEPLPVEIRLSPPSQRVGFTIGQSKCHSHAVGRYAGDPKATRFEYVEKVGLTQQNAKTIVRVPGDLLSVGLARSRTQIKSA
jgi:hypothetical protein